MQAREFLNMPAVINMEILCAQIELEHYKKLAGRIKNCLAETDEAKLQLKAANEKITEYKRLLSDKYLSLIEAENKISSAIDLLCDERVKTALKYRYICLMKFEEISEKMTYCVRQVRRYCEKGIEELDEVLQEKSGTS